MQYTILVELEHTGHGVLIPIQRARQLTPFILELIERDHITPLSLPTESCHIWTYQRGKAILRTDPLEARRLFTKSIELYPNRPAFEALFIAFLRHDLIPEAVSTLKDYRTATGTDLKLNKGVLALMETKGISVAELAP
ncbi:hypothetical protein SAMN05421641_13512 [Paracoccus thiocyanatus]|uniref:Tetratricopeptide repeat protein n=2 Tax=Paracoccus thiocyanatus TaxID=34006 RepID=A0A1N6ZHP3_9RHOB|nr:hypothetical protein SAMN05421641_13512 [Paracoccus thiocyanatus]